MSSTNTTAPVTVTSTSTATATETAAAPEAPAAAPAHDLAHLEYWFRNEFESAVINMRTEETKVEDAAKALLEKIAAKIKKV